MGIKYVKDFEFPAAAGFRDSAMPAKAGMSSKGMPSRAKPNAPARGAARMESKPKMGKGQGYAVGGKVPGYDMDRLPAKKPPGRTMDLATSKPFKGEYQGYAKGGKVAKFQRGGPSSRQSTGPTAPRTGYLPNPFGKSIPFRTGPTGGSQPRTPTTNPRDIFGNVNPYFVDRETPQMEQERYRNEGLMLAKGGKVSKVGKVMREYKAGKLHSGKDGKVVKNPKQAMAIALSEARKSGEKVKKLARGGPSSRQATGPTAPRTGYLPNPFGKSIPFRTGPTGGSQPRTPTTNPRDIFGNVNPYFVDRETPQMEQERYRNEGLEYAKGGKVGKYAKGGMMSKGPATRGTPAKGRAQGRMEFAEKYAPGLSLDMPGKRVKKK